MNSKQKQRKLSRNISVILAILIVATLCVTIAALTAARRSHSGTDKTDASSTVGTEATEPTAGSTQSTTEATQAVTQPTSGSNTPVAEVIVWSAPVAGGVVKEYSADVPVFSLTMEDYRVHTGIDIGADAGADVLAAADGVITDVRYDPMMGQTVVIDHGSGYVSIYQNMQTAVPDGIAVGAAVTGGQKIGTVGDTALIEISESPHLHFSMTQSGKYVSPLSYISVSATAGTVWYED